MTIKFDYLDPQDDPKNEEYRARCSNCRWIYVDFEGYAACPINNSTKCWSEAEMCWCKGHEPIDHELQQAKLNAAWDRVMEDLDLDFTEIE